MNSQLLKFKPAVPKRYLMLIAGIVWSFAGGMLFGKGINMLLAFPHEIWWKLLISVPLGIAFYWFMFSKIFKKHSERILAIEHAKPCVFSFFNWKSYIMMGSMITLGVLLRTTGIVPIRYLSLLYIAMGIPLSISAVMFYIYGIKYFNLSKENRNTDINP